MNLNANTWRMHMKLKRHIMIETPHHMTTTSTTLCRLRDPSNHRDVIRCSTFRGASRRSVSHKKSAFKVCRSRHWELRVYHHKIRQCRNIAANMNTGDGAHREEEVILWNLRYSHESLLMEPSRKLAHATN